MQSGQSSRGKGQLGLNASHQANVVVQGKQQVFVTPLTSGSINAGAGNGARDSVLSSGVNIRSGGESERARPVINKLLLRAFTKSSKNPKTFMLRDVPIYTTCEDLKEEIRAQLEGDVKQEFDVGYLEGSIQISIQTSHDLSEI